MTEAVDGRRERGGGARGARRSVKSGGMSMWKDYVEAAAADPKSFLERATVAQAVIGAKKERLEKWRALAKSLEKASERGAERGAESAASAVERGSALRDIARDIAAYERELCDAIEALMIAERASEDAIAVFVKNANRRAVLEMRYVSGYTLTKIAEKLRYSEAWVRWAHKKGLQDLQDGAREHLRGAGR